MLSSLYEWSSIEIKCLSCIDSKHQKSTRPLKKISQVFFDRIQSFYSNLTLNYSPQKFLKTAQKEEIILTWNFLIKFSLISLVGFLIIGFGLRRAFNINREVPSKLGDYDQTPSLKL